MQQNQSRMCRKRFLSIFLAFVLFIGSFSTIQLPTQATNETSDGITFSNDSESNLSTASISNETSEEQEEALSTVSENMFTDILEKSEGTEDSLSNNNVPESPDSSLEEAPEPPIEPVPTTYTLTIDYNGGVDAQGRTSYQIQADANTTLSTYLTQAESQNFYSPYTFANKWVLTYTDTGAGDSQTYRTAKSTKKVKDNYTLTAQWTSKYASYKINYVVNGGDLISEYEGAAIADSYTYADEIKLPTAIKKGYLFKGFYKDAACTIGPVTTIPKNSLGDITFYAKWESAISNKAPVLSNATNPSKGKVKVSFEKMSNIAGYELVMSTSKTFKKNTNTLILKASAASASLTNMPKGKTYYFKLRAFTYDSTGEKTYTSYSNTLKLKVTNGVQEYKATSTSAKLKSCSITNGDTLTVKFKVTKRIKSSDDSYYLVSLNPNTNAYLKKIEASAKLKTVTFSLPLRDNAGNDLIQGKYALAVKNGTKYKVISKGAFISNPEAAASYTGAFPVARSKKGMQGSTDSDLGLSHTFFNMNLNSILNGSIPYKYNGKTYYFNDPWSHVISACNEAGLTVTGQIMLSYNDSTKYMILKSGQTPGKPYYAINVQDKKARETFEAVMNFLAERYGREDCHLDNWIIGNEVNIHQAWYYAGNISRSAFMQNYASTFRIMYYAVRSHSANSRVYICTDHTWSDRNGDWGAKPFMTAFNKEIKAQQKNIQWDLAYHAYPSILTSSATWKDKYVTNKTDTEFVSPKNLSVLTKYVKKNFGSKTRIILSEQGFTSSSGQDVQAAAIAYTYYKAEFDSMIDAVIFRSDIDNAHEGAQGLYMGIKDVNGNKKPAYNVFKYMDTPQAEKYTNPYLKTIGISKWKDIAPKYTLNRFK